MLVGSQASFAIFLGGLLQWVVARVYTSRSKGEQRAEAARAAGNDTMLAGASIFAAGAILSIVVVVAKSVLDAVEVDLFQIAHQRQGVSCGSRGSPRR